MSQWTTLAARVGGKWQLPLLVVSTVTLPASVVMLRPNAGKLPLKEASETLGAYISSGAYERAIELGEILVARDDCVDEACAPVHLQMGRARFGLARRRAARTPAAGKAVLEHSREAAKYRQRFTAADYEHLGQRWSTYRTSLTRPQLDEAERLLDGAADRLNRVIACDEHDARVLSVRREAVARALQVSHSAGQAMRAYQQNAKGAGRLDCTDEVQ